MKVLLLRTAHVQVGKVGLGVWRGAALDEPCGAWEMTGRSTHGNHGNPHDAIAHRTGIWPYLAPLFAMDIIGHGLRPVEFVSNSEETRCSPRVFTDNAGIFVSQIVDEFEGCSGKKRVPELLSDCFRCGEKNQR